MSLFPNFKMFHSIYWRMSNNASIPYEHKVLRLSDFWRFVVMDAKFRTKMK